MPAAWGAGAKYAWMDHDPAYLEESPPVQNQWYTLYHEQDVRQLLMAIRYTDEEETGTTVEVRWTCDGNVYISNFIVANGVQTYIYKNKYNAASNNSLETDEWLNTKTVLYRDKRALDFLVEVRVTGNIGTGPHLRAYALYETLEAS